MDYKHLMIDLETLSTDSHAAILSVGAVCFDLNSKKIGPQFSVNVNLQDCIDAKMTISADTFYWWLQQSPESIKSLLEPRTCLTESLLKLTSFITKNMEQNFEIWSNGRNYDIPILRNAYNVCKFKVPWNYYAEKDCRTYIKEHSMFVDKKLNKHVAVDDCLYQIELMFLNSIYHVD